MTMNKENIKELLKHREPFLFIDTVNFMDDNKIETSLRIMKEDIQFKGHFPDNPIMPWVLLIEAIAQSSGYLIVNKVVQENKCRPDKLDYDSYLVKVNSAKFKEKIFPETTITFKATVKPIMSDFFEVIGQAYVENKLKAACNLTLYFKLKQKIYSKQ